MELMDHNEKNFLASPRLGMVTTDINSSTQPVQIQTNSFCLAPTPTTNHITLLVFSSSFQIRHTSLSLETPKNFFLATLGTIPIKQVNNSNHTNQTLQPRPTTPIIVLLLF